MRTQPRNHLVLLPGTRLVMLLLHVDGRRTVLTLRPAELLAGLRAAQALFGFDELQRDELPLDELLPWAGSL